MILDNNLIIVLSLVVLAFLCLLIVIFIVALFMRITGRGIIPMLLSIRQQFSEADPEDERHYVPKEHADLRSIAQKHDFNAALAQQVIEQKLEPPPPPPITAQNAPYVAGAAAPPSTDPQLHTPPPTFIPPTAQTPPGLAPRDPEARFGHRRRADERRKRDQEDEDYGGLLDAAGDDDLTD
jgi:hypothetical protein